MVTLRAGCASARQRPGSSDAAAGASQSARHAPRAVHKSSTPIYVRLWWYRETKGPAPRRSQWGRADVAAPNRKGQSNVV